MLEPRDREADLNCFAHDEELRPDPRKPHCALLLAARGRPISEEGKDDDEEAFVEPPPRAA